MLSLPVIGTRRIDLLLQGVRALELLPGPEPCCCNPQRQYVRRHCQIRMHQKPAGRVDALADALVLAAAHRRGEVHCLRSEALPSEFGRVTMNEYRAVAGGEPASRRVEMAPENVLLAHPDIGEEAVGRLRVRPVLTGKRYRASEARVHALDKLAKATVQSAVAETAARKLLVKPSLLHDLTYLSLILSEQEHDPVK